MPPNKDEGHGGTNADGTKSAEYCSHCFQNGRFTEPDLTADQMQEKVKGKIMNMGFPKFAAGFMAKSIPKLKRWKNN